MPLCPPQILKCKVFSVSNEASHYAGVWWSGVNSTICLFCHHIVVNRPPHPDHFFISGENVNRDRLCTLCKDVLNCSVYITIRKLIVWYASRLVT